MPAGRQGSWFGPPASFLWPGLGLAGLRPSSQTPPPPAAPRRGTTFNLTQSVILFPRRGPATPPEPHGAHGCAGCASPRKTSTSPARGAREAARGPYLWNCSRFDVARGRGKSDEGRDIGASPAQSAKHATRSAERPPSPPPQSTTPRSFPVYAPAPPASDHDANMRCTLLHCCRAMHQQRQTWANSDYLETVVSA